MKTKTIERGTGRGVFTAFYEEGGIKKKFLDTRFVNFDFNQEDVSFQGLSEDGKSWVSFSIPQDIKREWPQSVDFYRSDVEWAVNIDTKPIDIESGTAIVYFNSEYLEDLYGDIELTLVDGKKVTGTFEIFKVGRNKDKLAGESKAPPTR